MKFLNYLQLALSVFMFVGVIALIIKNIVIGNMGPLGIPLAASFFILTGMFVLYALGDIKDSKDNEKTLGGKK